MPLVVPPVPLEVFFTPGDTPPLAEFLAYQQADKGFRYSVYSATHADFFAALATMGTKMVDIEGTCDWSEEHNPNQRMNWIAAHQKTPLARMGIGTSTAKRILHKKEMVINVPLDGVWVPTNQTTDWRTAAAAGLPVWWGGSWNLDLNADKQANEVLIIPSPVLAQAAAAAIEDQYAWVMKNEPQYQFGVSSTLTWAEDLR